MSPIPQYEEVVMALHEWLQIPWPSQPSRYHNENLWTHAKVRQLHQRLCWEIRTHQRSKWVTQHTAVTAQLNLVTQEGFLQIMNTTSEMAKCIPFPALHTSFPRLASNGSKIYSAACHFTDSLHKPYLVTVHSFELRAFKNLFMRGATHSGLLRCRWWFPLTMW